VDLRPGNRDLIDDEDLSNSNRNRYVGAWQMIRAGSPKVHLAQREVGLIDPRIRLDHH
jgi:tRNA A37 threonylcarbamoyladenosine dehydratase